MASLPEARSVNILNRWASKRVRFRTRQHIAEADSPSSCVFLLQRGWAVRHRSLCDGRRQITSYYVPGDICDLSWLQGSTVGQSVQAVSDIEAIEMPCGEVQRQARSDRHHHDQLNQEMALTAAIQAEHSMSLGRRTAAERLAHLFCEIYWRMDAAGHVILAECSMPLTQVDLADMCGLTPIHVNRILQELRGAGFIELKSRRLKVPDIERLVRLAMFDPRYLSGLSQERIGNSTN